MEQYIHPKIRGIEVSGIRQMANRVSRYENVLSLTLGQPDFPTPAHIVEAAKRAMDRGHTAYTPNAGIPELRAAASAFVEEKYGLRYRAEDEVLVTSGASQALDIALRAVLQPGCEVVLPSPVYPGYEPLIGMYGGVSVHVDTTSNGFKLTAELIAPRLTEKTRCIVLASPSNPTGVVMSEAELADIAALLKDRDIFVISDEIYSELVYDGSHRSIASQPGIRDKTIVINGLSKSHAMTGWRIGFVFAPADIAKHLVKVLNYSVTCASSISQHAALAALTAGKDDAAPMRDTYVRRRDYVFERLTAAGFEVHKPGGAFYMFPSVRRFGLDSTAFAHRLLDEQRVAVVPGGAFHRCGEGFVRISYASSMDVIEEAMRRIAVFVDSLTG